MAPLAPFVTERVWRDMFVASGDAATGADVPESVHLSDWPQRDPALIDADLSEQVKLARRLVELGRAARASAKVRTRQPLRRALVATTAHRRLSDELQQEVAEELNIDRLEPLSAAGADLVDHTAKGNFRALGKRFAKDTPRVAGAIAEADAEALAAALASEGRATVQLDGTPVEVLPDEVILSERPREGWSVINEQGETVALDLEITPELRRAGLAREVIRMIQEARKANGFEVSDRIALSWAVLDREGAGEGAQETAQRMAQTMEEHRDLIAAEVLASTIAEADSAAGLAQSDADLGLAFTVHRI
jgi:isoleucyl-tRNA synthetase